MAAKIRRDDEVIVLTGKDKGKRGKVKNVLSSGKVIVEGINLVKKHQKPVPYSEPARRHRRERSSYSDL